MQVIFESRDPDGARMRALVQRRVLFVLRRVTWLVPRVRVHLSDINGPASGLDKRCLLELATPAGRPVVITSLARDWRTALEAALARASQSLLRTWRRARELRRARRLRRPSHA